MTLRAALLAAAPVDHEEIALELARLPEGWWRPAALAALAALVASVVWLYRREARVGAGPRLRVALAALRCAVLGLLAAIWLEPVRVRYTRQTVPASVAVLIDASASMSIADDGGADAPERRRTRIQRVAELLRRDDHAWLRRLASRNQLRVYTFGDRMTPVRVPFEAGPSDAATLEEDLVAAQDATDLGDAVTGAIDAAAGGPLAGIVVLSDGGVNRGLSAADAALVARRAKAPIYAVGVGRPEEPPNLRVASLAAPATTPLGDPIELRVELAAAGLDPVGVRVELTAQRVGRPGGELEAERPVGAREVTIGGDRSTREVLFQLLPDQPGEVVYRARVAPLPQEAVESDNRRAASVLVLEEKLHVLIVAGRPTFDYRALTRLLERERSIAVSCWLQSADPRAIRDGDLPITELPRRAEDLLQYDVVVLIDPDPRELDSAWAIAVRRLVDGLGGGLLFQAGPHYTSRFLSDARLDELISMLPITPDPDADVRLTAAGSFRTVGSPFQAPPEALTHPLLRLSSDDEVNREVWAALPGAWWHFPVLREKPLATVLLRHPGRAQANPYGLAVLMAAQPVGAGRALFVGFDSTWRWRATSERTFNRFWIQAIRYLAQARRQGMNRRGTIVVDRDPVVVGDVVRVEARVLDESFAPWPAPAVAADLIPDDGPPRELPFEAIPGREGWFASRLLLEQPGAATIRLRLPRAAPSSAPEESLVKRFSVLPPDRELRSLRLNVEELQTLAERTEGRYVPLDDAADLPDWIEDATVEKPPVAGPSVALWDRAGLLWLIAGLLIVEWTLRRRNHLL